MVGWLHGTAGDGVDRQGNRLAGLRLRRSLHEIEMATTQASDPVLTRFRQALDEIYGNRLDRVVLFGSRARGDARPDSDYDVGSLHDLYKIVR